jgi:hypothetical protein
MNGAEFELAQQVLRANPGQPTWARCNQCNDPATQFVQTGPDEFILFDDMHAPAYAESLNLSVGPAITLSLNATPIISGARPFPSNPAALREALLPSNLTDTVSKLSGPGFAKLRSLMSGKFGIRYQSTGVAANRAQTRILMQTVYASTKNPYMVNFDQVILDPFTGTDVAATGVLTSDNTAPADGATVTIGTKVYTFKTTLTPTEGQVLINSTADAALLNLIRAINHTGTANTDYKCAAANPDVTAASSVTAHAFQVTATIPGVSTVATTETSAHLSWGAVTLVGGSRAGQFDLVERNSSDVVTFDDYGNIVPGGSQVTLATKSGFTGGNTTGNWSSLAKVITVDKTYSVVFVPGAAGDGSFSISIRGLNTIALAEA